MSIMTARSDGTQLAAREVTVTYDVDPVVKQVSVQLIPGQVTVFIGPNGSGKTTLLRGLCRLADIEGTVTLRDVDVSSMSTREFAKQLTVLAQQRPTPAGLTVGDVVELGRHPHVGRFSRADPDGAEAIAWAIDITGLDEFRHRPVTELSGGQLQRVWLATCLAQQTDVLLLDEPTTFLDLKHQVSLLDLVADLAGVHGLTVGLVLHDLEQAADIADRVLLLDDGEIVADGSPRHVMTSERLSQVYGVDIEVGAFPDGNLMVRANRAGRRSAALLTSSAS